MTTVEELSEASIGFFLKGHCGPGWYAWYAEYPDEGSFFYVAEPTDDDLRKVGLTRRAADE